MGFVAAVGTCLRKYAVFAGRARRSEYWYFILFSIVMEIGARAVEATISSLADVFLPVSRAVWLALLLPALAVAVRRIHDTNWSGWWVAGFYVDGIAVATAFVPVVRMFQIGAITPIWFLTGVIAVLIFPYAMFILILTVREGTRGTNRYGPDPKAPDVDAF